MKLLFIAPVHWNFYRYRDQELPAEMAKRGHACIYLNPVRYFMEIMRGVWIKGAGISVLWPQMLILAVYGAIILGLSALRFHKTLD